MEFEVMWDDGFRQRGRSVRKAQAAPEPELSYEETMAVADEMIRLFEGLAAQRATLAAEAILNKSGGEDLFSRFGRMVRAGR